MVIGIEEIHFTSSLGLAMSAVPLSEAVSEGLGHLTLGFDPALSEWVAVWAGLGEVLGVGMSVARIVDPHGVSSIWVLGPAVALPVAGGSSSHVHLASRNAGGVAHAAIHHIACYC